MIKKLKYGVFTSSAILFVLIIISKFIGFFRDISLSFVYGTSIISDAYLISISIPTVIFTGLISSMMTAYMPIVNNIKDKKEVSKFNNNLLSIIVVFSFIMSIIFFLGSGVLIKIFGSGLNNEAFKLASSFLKVTIWCLPFLSSGFLFVAILQQSENYIQVGMNGIILNIFILLGIFISKYNLIFLTIMVLIGYIVQSAYFYFITRRNKLLSFHFIIRLKDRNIIKMFKLMIPVFLGQIIGEINNIVDKNLASRLAIGTITSLDYSYKIIAMIQGIAIFPIATVVFTKISKIIKNNRTSAYNIINTTINIGSMIIIPINVFLFFYSREIIKLFFYRGAFDIEALLRTTDCLEMYSLGLTPFALRCIIEKIFFADSDSKTPMITSVIGIFFNIILNIIFMRYYGHSGIALATSCSFWINFILLFIITKKRYKIFNRLDKKIYLVILYFVFDIFTIVIIKNFIFIKNLFFYITISLLLFISIHFVLFLLVYIKKSKKGEVHD